MHNARFRIASFVFRQLPSFNRIPPKFHRGSSQLPNAHHPPIQLSPPLLNSLRKIQNGPSQRKRSQRASTTSARRVWLHNSASSRARREWREIHNGGEGEGETRRERRSGFEGTAGEETDTTSERRTEISARSSIFTQINSHSVLISFPRNALQHPLSISPIHPTTNLQRRRIWERTGRWGGLWMRFNLLCEGLRRHNCTAWDRSSGGRLSGRREDRWWGRGWNWMRFRRNRLRL